MVSSNVNKIFQAVQALDDTEQAELVRLLKDRTANRSEVTKQQQLRQQLLAEGLLSHIPSKEKDAERFRRWQPIPIKGKPLSETIIEERR